MKKMKVHIRSIRNVQERVGLEYQDGRGEDMSYQEGRGQGLEYQEGRGEGMDKQEGR